MPCTGINKVTRESSGFTLAHVYPPRMKDSTPLCNAIVIELEINISILTMNPPAANRGEDSSRTPLAVVNRVMTYWALTGVISTSMRRLVARPSAVVLGARGLSGPYPVARIRLAGSVLLATR